MERTKTTSLESWLNLEAHFDSVKNKSIYDRFKANPSRFDDFSIQWNDFLLDYSKNKIDQETIDLLIELAAEVKLDEAIKAMFSGEKINKTENRAVLHTALRNKSDEPVYVDGHDVMPDVQAELDKMAAFCEKVHSGDWRGYTGKKIKYIVNIGIGGSDLGPVMVTEALKPYWI